MDAIFKKNYDIRYHEADFRGRALPLTLINDLQDAAGEHAAALGFSVLALKKKNMTWLLSRYHVKVLRYPAFGETMTVSTWPSGRQGIFALRDFEAVDGRGRPVLAATSSWILWNLASRQPARLEENLPDRFTVERRALADDFAPLPPCDTPGRVMTFRVWMQDIDFNNHANHASYILWALETPPEDVLRSWVPVDIEVAYRAEAFYGDEVASRLQAVAGVPEATFIHSLVHASKGTELARLRTVWRKA